MNADLIHTSKFMSRILRHRPQDIGVTLDENGWLDVEELIQGSLRRGRSLSRPLIDEVVAQDDKQRFAFSADGRMIRASQGHSVNVDLELLPQQPPEILYHGTAEKFLGSILVQGLRPRTRRHVHLSLDEQTALKVGQRHGEPVILTAKAGDMWRAGMLFYCSENGIWLTDTVPVGFLEISQSTKDAAPVTPPKIVVRDPSERGGKPSWMFNQSAVVPFVVGDNELQIVLVTSRKSNTWIIPKGVIERPLSAKESAVKEAWEEAGVLGTANDVPLGNYKFAKWGGTCSVEVFAMNVTEILDAWPEQRKRQRRIVPALEALQLLEGAEVVGIVQKLITRLSNGTDDAVENKNFLPV